MMVFQGFSLLIAGREMADCFNILFFILSGDRIILGEVRDAAACELLNVMNTGHDGSLCTGHANSPKDMLNRLETLVLIGMDIPLLAVRNQIASALDIVVQLGRLRDKTRKILEIDEIIDRKSTRLNSSHP